MNPCNEEATECLHLALFYLASKAAIGTEPDIRNFDQMAALSALLPFVACAANDWIEPKLPDAAQHSYWNYVP